MFLQHAPPGYEPDIWTNSGSVYLLQVDTLGTLEMYKDVKGHVAYFDSLAVIDATNADTTLLYDDGDTTRLFSNNNPIKIGASSLIIGDEITATTNLVVEDTIKGTLIYVDSLIINGGYTRSKVISASAAGVGVTAPTATITGTFYGLGFDADAETAYFKYEVQEDWDGSSDMVLKIYWSPTNGDVIANGETVKFDASYRSIAEGEAIDNGTAVDITETYTQSGAGTDKEYIITEITIDYDNGNQPLTKGDIVGIVFNRDVTTDTYSGDAIVSQWEIDFTSVTLSVH